MQASQGANSPSLWERLLSPENKINPASTPFKPEEIPEPDAAAPATDVRSSNTDTWHSETLSQDLHALTLKRRYEASGLFGVGLQVSDDPPHSVQRVTRLLGKDRRNISDTVSIGDTLYSVNDFPVEMSSIDTVEQLIFGDLGTTVHLTFCNSKRHKYDVVAMRHVPISVWEQERVWYEIKPEHQGKELRCDPSIVNILETIRCLHMCYSWFVFTRDQCLRFKVSSRQVFPELILTLTYSLTLQGCHDKRKCSSCGPAEGLYSRTDHVGLSNWAEIP